MNVKMSRDEAFKILNIEDKNADLDAIQEVTNVQSLFSL